jgi:WD40 repeat protein
MLDGSIRAVDPADTTREAGQWSGHQPADVSVIEAHPAGALLATGGDDRAIVVWDVDGQGQLTERRRLIGHTDRVTSLAFSADGRWLASGGEDRRVLLWDLSSGEQVGDPIPTSVEPAIAYAPTEDRQLLVSVGGVSRWDMRPDGWTRIACEIVGGRTFVTTERDRFLRGGGSVARCP